MHVAEESSGGIVPTKCPNKSVRSLAEGMEGRPLAEENTLQPPRSGLSARQGGCVGCGVCGREPNGCLSAMDPRWEPDAVVPRVRVCAGGGG